MSSWRGVHSAWADMCSFIAADNEVFGNRSFLGQRAPVSAVSAASNRERSWRRTVEWLVLCPLSVRFDRPQVSLHLGQFTHSFTAIHLLHLHFPEWPSQAGSSRRLAQMTNDTSRDSADTRQALIHCSELHSNFVAGCSRKVNSIHVRAAINPDIAFTWSEHHATRACFCLRRTRSALPPTRISPLRTRCFTARYNRSSNTPK